MAAALNVTYALSDFSSPIAADQSTQHYPLTSIFFGIFVIIHVILGTAGNAMVIAAIRQSSRLQSKSDYLIGSLAVADLLVSILVVPLASTIILWEKRSSQAWANHPIFCGVYIFFDVTCCTVSILHLCAIAWVRYQSVTNAKNAFKTAKLKSVLPLVTILWTVASVLSIFPLFIFGSMTNGSTKNTNSSNVALASSVDHHLTGITCAVNMNKIYRVFATIIAFYGPLLAIIIIYIKMARIAWSKARERGFRSTVHRQRRNYILPTVRKTFRRLFPRSQSAGRSGTKPTETRNNVAIDKGILQSNIEVVAQPLTSSSAQDYSERDALNFSNTGSGTYSAKVVFKRERKILLTLGMIIGAFIVCWLPFFVKELVVPFCNTCELSFVGETIINWLGYLNSILNPIIYGYTNKDFNKAFRKMLCIKR